MEKKYFNLVQRNFRHFSESSVLGVELSVFRIARAEYSRGRLSVRRWAVGVLGIWKGWDSWVKGGANRVSLQAT